MFTHSDIARQKVFMHSAEGAQKITCPGPHSFGSIHMDFPEAITIIIPCPFVFPMLNRDVLAFNPVVTLPFIGVHHGVRWGEASDMLLQGFAIRVFDDAQAHLSALASDRAHDRQTVIVIGPMAFVFVGPPPRGIVGIAMFFAFFPPHSETFHRFP